MPKVRDKIITVADALKRFQEWKESNHGVYEGGGLSGCNFDEDMFCLADEYVKLAEDGFYVVVSLNQDYDYVEDVECTKSFKTEEEAQAFIHQKEKERFETWQAKKKYVEEYVDSLVIPENGPEWGAWATKIHKRWYSCFVNPNNIREDLKRELITKDYAYELENWNPPQLINLPQMRIMKVSVPK